jgi:hypothetical protein
LTPDVHSFSGFLCCDSRKKTPFWQRLVEALYDLKIDIGTLQAQLADKSPACALFVEGDSTDPPPDGEAKSSGPIDESVYWFILATNALEELLPLSSEQDAQAAAFLALQWTDLFAGQKLNSASSSRSLVGRAILVVTEACTQAISMYHDNMSVMMASIISLDAVSVASSYDRTDWSNGVLPSWRDYINDTVDLVLPTKKVSWSKLEACLDAFETKQFDPFLQIPKIPVTDVRLALKRWSALSLTWFGGQEMIFKALVDMMKSCPNFSGCGRVLSLSNNKKNRSAVRVPVPSHATLLTMVGRLCRILAAGSSVGGSKGPGGSFVVYMKEIADRAESTDPYHDDLCASLLQISLQRHSETLSRWVHLKSESLSCLHWKVPEGYKVISKIPQFFEDAISFYPFMDKLVGDVLSLVPNRVLQFVAMAWILQDPIKDANLCRWAIIPLSAEMELLPRTNESLDKFLLAGPAESLASGKSKLRKRKKAPDVSDESLVVTSILEKQDHSRHDRFAVLLRLVPQIMDSLLTILEGLYDTGATETKGQRDTKSAGKPKKVKLKLWTISIGR